MDTWRVYVSYYYFDIFEFAPDIFLNFHSKKTQIHSSRPTALMLDPFEVPKRYFL